MRNRFGPPAFLDQNHLSIPAADRWARTSPQHVTAAALDRLFPPGFLDHSFAVVRHPVDRLVSAFHFMKEARFLLDAGTHFSDWLKVLDRTLAKDPWLHDAHLRPMVDFVPAGADVFRLEDGLDRVGRHLDALFGRPAVPVGFGRELERQADSPKAVPSPQDIAVIERLYAADYDRFGYDRHAISVPRAVAAHRAEVAVKPLIVLPDLDRAERLRDRGLALFQSGDAAGAHARFRLALNCAPDDAGLHALIANTALRLGALHLAADHAERALSQQPDNLDARLALAGARLRLKEPSARALVHTLMEEESLGDFRRLLANSLALIEGEAPEAILLDLADYMESHPQDMLCGELFSNAFRALRALEDGERCDEFLSGVAVLPDATAPVAPKPAVAEPRSVDIIIPVYNAVEDLKRCLASLRRWPSALMGRIILVDDCSAAETAAWLSCYRDDHDDVTVIRTPNNMGFTRAVTTGVAASAAPFMLFLNSDTLVTPDWLDAMMEALLSDPQAAMAGPLSDNGFHQTIRPEAQAGQTPPSDATPEDAAALVRAVTRRAFPRMPLLSGFCLLVHRAAYDAVGGLDAAIFPHGYGEVQDLCLRLTDIGYASVLADNAFVHHAGGASIASQRKLDLTREGYLQLYQRHSALRLMVAEAVSASEPEVARHKHFWSTRAELAAPVAVQKPSGPPRQDAEMQRRIALDPQLPFDGQEVCLFVAHAPLGAVQDCTLTYLAELRRAGLRVVLCLVVDDLAIPFDLRLSERVDGIILRENGGFDFGAWADVLRDLPELWQAERLYFVNDSLLGPFGPLDQVFDRIRAEDAGFFAMTECSLIRPHAQSFFFGWNRQNLQARHLRNFWAEVTNLCDKDDVIQSYELTIADLSMALPDPTRQVLFGFEAAYGCTAEELPNFSLSHQGWKRMISFGIPLVKTTLLRDGSPLVDTVGWEAFCAAQGADVPAMQRSMELSRLNRMRLAGLDPDEQ